MDADEEEAGALIGESAAVEEGDGGIGVAGEGDLPAGGAELGGEGLADGEGPFFFVLTVFAETAGVGAAVAWVDDDVGRWEDGCWGGGDGWRGGRDGDGGGGDECGGWGGEGRDVFESGCLPEAEG